MITGAIEEVGDSLVFHARVSDVAGAKLIAMVRVASPATRAATAGVEEVRDQVRRSGREVPRSRLRQPRIRGAATTAPGSVPQLHPRTRAIPEERIPGSPGPFPEGGLARHDIRLAGRVGEVCRVQCGELDTRGLDRKGGDEAAA